MLIKNEVQYRTKIYFIELFLVVTEMRFQKIVYSYNFSHLFLSRLYYFSEYCVVHLIGIHTSQKILPLNIRQFFYFKNFRDRDDDALFLDVLETNVLVTSDR